MKCKIPRHKLEDFNHNKISRPIPSHVETNMLKWCEAVPCEVPARAIKCCTPQCVTTAISVRASIIEFGRHRKSDIWRARTACKEFDRLLVPGYMPNCLLVTGCGGYASMARWDNRWWIILGARFKYRKDNQTNSRWGLTNSRWGLTRTRVSTTYVLHGVPEYVHRSNDKIPYYTDHLDRFYDQCCQLLAKECTR